MTASGFRFGGALAADAGPRSARGCKTRGQFREGSVRTLASALSAEAPSTSDEDRGLVLEDDLAGGLVFSLAGNDDCSSLALVKDFE